jgi:hypothetical protein
MILVDQKKRLGFVEAARAYIAGRESSEIEKLVIGALLDLGAIGCGNAVPLPQLASLCSTGLVEVNGGRIQRQVLVPSRSTKQKHFIGSCFEGIFLIDTAEDVEVMREFYLNRVRAEICHLNHLNDLAGDTKQYWLSDISADRAEV